MAKQSKWVPTQVKGFIKVKDVEAQSVTVALGGFDPPTNQAYHYEVAIGTDLLAPWVNIGRNLVYTKTGLSPKTKYKVWAKCVGYYGIISTARPIEFTTTDEQSFVYIKVNGKWTKGKVFVKDRGAWKKAKKIYVNKKGKWTDNKS